MLSESDESSTRKREAKAKARKRTRRGWRRRKTSPYPRGGEEQKKDVIGDAESSYSRDRDRRATGRGSPRSER